MTEQRYRAVQAVLGDGRAVGQVASEWAACRQTMQRWLARYEALEGRRAMLVGEVALGGSDTRLAGAFVTAEERVLASPSGTSARLEMTQGA